MKKHLLKSALIAMAGVGLLAGGAMAVPVPQPTPSGDWENLEQFLALNYFPGSETQITSYNFTGKWIFTAIGKESGNPNDIELSAIGQAGTGNSNNTIASFSTEFFDNWGAWQTVDFNTQNLYFEDTDGGYNIGLDPYTYSTTATNTFKIYQLSSDSMVLNYLTYHPTVKLKKGDFIIGFNDNAAGGDGDFDDIIIALRPVPEPGTILLFGTGLAGLAAVGRRRKSQA